MINPALLEKPATKPVAAVRSQQAKPSRPVNEIVIERELSAKESKISSDLKARMSSGAPTSPVSTQSPGSPAKRLTVASNANEALDAAARRASGRSKPVCGQCEDKPAIVVRANF